MTPCEVGLDITGKITLQDIAHRSVALYVHYDADKMTASSEDISITDDRLKSVWGSGITRIILRVDSPPLRDTLRLRIAP